MEKCVFQLSTFCKKAISNS